jgi:NAD(P)H dehydrogenase (quinone)
MKDHWLAERVFDWSGLNVAHIRPTLFAEWLLYAAPMIKAGLLHVPFGTGRHAPITAEDQARVIVGILEDPSPHKGGIYPLFGPVEFSYEETAKLLSRILGKAIEYRQVSFEEFKQTLRSSGKTSANGQGSRSLAAKSERTAEEKAGDDFLFQHLNEVAVDHQNGVVAGTNGLVEKLGGRPPMTLEAFIEKHRASFV